MFSGSKNQPPPPPTYNEVTGFSGLSNQYNTEYSQPLGQSSVQPAQPAQPQSFGQPQTYGQAPTYGNPQTFGQPHSVPRPLTYSQPQSFGQHSSQLPTSTSIPPYPTQGGRNQPAVTSMTSGQQQQNDSPVTKQQEMQRKAIIALVCFVPLGIWAWSEYKKATEAYSRGNDQAGKLHERKVHKLMNTAIGVGIVIMVLIIFNPFKHLIGSDSTYRRDYGDP